MKRPIMTTGIHTQLEQRGLMYIPKKGQSFYDGVLSANFKWKLVSWYRRQPVSPLGTAILITVWLILEAIRNG